MVDKSELKVLGSYKNPKTIIGDKHYLLASNSDKFEPIEPIENKEYILYHIVLENEDAKKQYGIYVNDGILSETCSEKAYIQKYGRPKKLTRNKK